MKRKYRILSNGDVFRLQYKDMLFWNFVYQTDDRGVERFENFKTLEEVEHAIECDKAIRRLQEWKVVKSL